MFDDSISVCFMSNSSLIVPMTSFNILFNKSTIIDRLDHERLKLDTLEYANDRESNCTTDSDCPKNQYCVINLSNNFTFCKGIKLT